MAIVIETRHAGRKTEERLPADESELVAALAKLDGNRTTVFTVTVIGNHLLVGGGEGRYTVTAMMEDGRSCVLVGGQQAIEDTAMLILGGQRTPQPLRYIVDGLRALKVARHFLRTGHMDEEEQWEEP
jgi:hypothetical protein